MMSTAQVQQLKNPGCTDEVELPGMCNQGYDQGQVWWLPGCQQSLCSNYRANNTPLENEEDKIIEIKEEIINEDQLNALNKALDEKVKEIIQLDETINEEQLDNLIAAINSKEQEEVMDVIGEVFDSSFEVKSKPKPNKTVLLSALEDSLSNQIDSLTSYSPTQSAYIQIGAFKKENISQAVASDVSNKIGTDVEVIPTLISDPVMYRILVGPTHKDEIVGVIADIMELGISDYFLTHG